MDMINKHYMTCNGERYNLLDRMLTVAAFQSHSAQAHGWFGEHFNRGVASRLFFRDLLDILLAGAGIFVLALFALAVAPLFFAGDSAGSPVFRRNRVGVIGSLPTRVLWSASSDVGARIKACINRGKGYGLAPGLRHGQLVFA